MSNDAISDFYKEHLTKEKIDQLIADCKENKITLHDKHTSKKYYWIKLTFRCIKTLRSVPQKKAVMHRLRNRPENPIPRRSCWNS